jgi:aryl-alcohol dehydrogenase-like predicted oxidoreductase
MSRLALGTAQFGMAYGVGNSSGQVSQEAVRDILEQANAKGIDTLDTAIAYGNSEQVLGVAGMSQWRVITKLPPLPDDVNDVAAWAKGQVIASLDRLGVSKLYGLLLHRPELLLGPHRKALLQVFEDLKGQGKVQKTGISIYGPSQLDQLDDLPEIDLVQSPLSLFDQRLIASGWLSRLQDCGVEVHTRSAFLQGLLLMPAYRRPRKFDRWSDVWQVWDSWLSQTGLSPLKACLYFVLSVSGVSRVIVGLDSTTQLTEILENMVPDGLPSLPAWLKPLDEELVNPSLWSSL